MLSTPSISRDETEMVVDTKVFPLCLQRPVYTPGSVVSLFPFIKRFPSFIRSTQLALGPKWPRNSSPYSRFRQRIWCSNSISDDSCRRRRLNRITSVNVLRARYIEDCPGCDGWISRISKVGTAPGTATHHPRRSASLRLSNL
jgi:hypothetical protein